jgi:uncharacterized protein YciI
MSLYLDGASEPVRLDQHTIVMLRLRPDAPPMSDDQAAALQDAHLAFHADQAAAGHLLAFGPPAGQDDPTLRGLSIWSVDRDTARQLAEQDPLVQAGRLAVEIASWLTPAGQLRFASVRVPRAMAEVAP